jgi:hypothetical protein
MGKCFLLQVRRGLSLSSLAIATLIPHDDDPPEATSAIEAHRYRVQPFAAEIYARSKVALHLTSATDIGSCNLGLEKSYEVC